MFDAGIGRLLEALPEIEGLGGDDVRRLLSSAFIDIVEIRDFEGEADASEHIGTLRKLATTLELEAVLGGDLGSETSQACAFVAAEALELVRDLDERVEGAEEGQVGVIPSSQYTSIEAASLYLIAGFDANGAVAARQIAPQSIAAAELPDAAPAARMAASARAFFELRRPPTTPNPGPPDDLSTSDRIRWEVWRRIAEGLDEHVRWLLEGGSRGDVPNRLAELAERLDRPGFYTEASHLAVLLSAATAATAGRALHGLTQNAEGTLSAYINQRALTRPVLWPAAAAYAGGVLGGEARHAVVAVPTGAGKSSVAELGIAAVLDEGWALYLTPTNALAGQVARDLSHQFADLDGVSVKGFLGGAEFTALADESVGGVEERQVLVMTPEKCSLALRQAPEAFGRLSVLVMDECHLLGDPGARGVTAELTVSAVLELAPDARVIMLSALLANSEEIGAWLTNATGGAHLTVTNSWRPTRTLRAVLGIDTGRGTAAFETVAAELRDKDQKEKKFEAPVNLLANHQGAWKTLDPGDYTVIQASFTVPLTAEQRNGSVVASRTGYVNSAAGRVTERLAAAGERVLTFLPANRHHAFSVARDLADLEPQPRANAHHAEVEALLDLAQYELGLESALRRLIDRGVAVHTSAMLRDEQRASELSFSDGQVRAIFATTTLAQGLNLPATAVVIGGTQIGDPRDVPTDIQKERARADLLNAIGRAGRAYVSARSIGVVIPNRVVEIAAGDSPEAARRSAPFLQYEDASTQVESQIQALIRTALDDPEVQIGRLTEEELAAFTFLASDDPSEGQAVIRRSFGAFREGLTDNRALEVSEAINLAGQVFVRDAEAPEWIVEASRVSGIGLPTMGALVRSLTALEFPVGETLGSWREILISVLKVMPPRLVASLLPEQPFKSTRMEALIHRDSPAEEWAIATAVLDGALDLWMSGESLDGLVEQTTGKKPGNAGRGSGNPLPKMIVLTENGFGFGVSRLAGGLAALFAVGGEIEPEALPELTTGQRYALDLFPLAVRFGCDSPASIAWYRWGSRRRRIAHLLASELPPPEDLSRDNLSAWILDKRRELMAGNLDEGLSGELADLIPKLRLAEAA
jgi:hypothetical protein